MPMQKGSFPPKTAVGDEIPSPIPSHKPFFEGGGMLFLTDYRSDYVEFPVEVGRIELPTS